MTVVTMQWGTNACPNFITTKRKKMKKLKLRGGGTAQLKDPKTWPFILLTVQSPYVASHCTPYT